MATLTWDPADSGYALTNGSLTATSDTSARICRGTKGKSAGKWYYTLKYNSGSSMCGIARKASTAYNSTSGFAVSSVNGKKYGSSANWTAAAYTTGWTTQTIDVAINLDEGKVIYYKDGTNLGEFTFTLTGTGLIYPFLANGGNAGSVTIVPSTKKIAGYMWWGEDEPLITQKKRNVSDVLNYGGRIPTGMGF